MTVPSVAPAVAAVFARERPIATAAAIAAAQADIPATPKGPGGCIADACGVAWVATYDPRSVVTAALTQVGFAEPWSDGVICIENIPLGIGELIITAHEVAARAAAVHLTVDLGQEFFVHSRMD